MSREEVLELIRAHLADELELDPARIALAKPVRVKRPCGTTPSLRSPSR